MTAFEFWRCRGPDPGVESRTRHPASPAGSRARRTGLGLSGTTHRYRGTERHCEKPSFDTHGEAAPPAGAAAVPSFEPFGNVMATNHPPGLPSRSGFTVTVTLSPALMVFFFQPS